MHNKAMRNLWALWFIIPTILYAATFLITYINVFMPAHPKFIETNTIAVAYFKQGALGYFVLINIGSLFLLSCVIPTILYHTLSKYKIIPLIIPLLFLPAIILDLTNDIGVAYFRMKPISETLIYSLYWWR